MIIDRYLIRLVLFPTLAGFALLILLVSAFNAAALLRDAAYSRIPMNQVFTLIGLRDLIAAEVLLPTSLYMGVLTTLNQWHREREAFALYGAGVLPGRAAYPVWLIALIVCSCVAALVSVCAAVGVRGKLSSRCGIGPADDERDATRSFLHVRRNGRADRASIDRPRQTT